MGSDGGGGGGSGGGECMGDVDAKVCVVLGGVAMLSGATRQELFVGVGHVPSPVKVHGYPLALFDRNGAILHLADVLIAQHLHLLQHPLHPHFRPCTAIRRLPTKSTCPKVSTPQTRGATCRLPEASTSEPSGATDRRPRLPKASTSEPSGPTDRRPKVATSEPSGAADRLPKVSTPQTRGATDGRSKVRPDADGRGGTSHASGRRRNGSASGSGSGSES